METPRSSFWLWTIVTGLLLFFAISLCSLSAITFYYLPDPTPVSQDPPTPPPDPSHLAQLDISIWPEYDQSAVLVILEGTLASQEDLPRQVTVLIPSSAQLYVTTFENPDGTLAKDQGARVTDRRDGYQSVSFMVAQRKFHVEYYHDIIRGSTNKIIQFAYRSLLSADRGEMTFQQPKRASRFAVAPKPESTHTDANGFTYFVVPLSGIAAGQTLTATVSYTKSDLFPSVIK